MDKTVSCPVRRVKVLGVQAGYVMALLECGHLIGREIRENEDAADLMERVYAEREIGCGQCALERVAVQT